MKNIIALILIATPLIAQCDIVFTPFSGTLGEFTLDIDNNGSDDYRLYSYNLDQLNTVNIEPYNSNNIIFPDGPLGGALNISALASGDLIDQQTKLWESRTGLLSISNFTYPDGGTVGGPFINTNGYIGISFLIDSNTHYGWIGIDNPSSQPGGTITGFAYETNPDTGIIAGAIPEPGTVVLLSIGSIGLYLMRKNKTHRTSHSTLR